MFVNHTACRSKKALPSPLPRLVRDVGVLDVERSIEGIKATDCCEFLPIYGAGSTSGPEDGNGIEVLVARLDIIVPEVKKPSFESCAGFTRFFAATTWIGKKNLGRYGEDGFILKTLQQRWKE